MVGLPEIAPEAQNSKGKKDPPYRPWERDDFVTFRKPKRQTQRKRADPGRHPRVLRNTATKIADEIGVHDVNLVFQFNLLGILVHELGFDRDIPMSGIRVILPARRRAR